MTLFTLIILCYRHSRSKKSLLKIIALELRDLVAFSVLHVAFSFERRGSETLKIAMLRDICSNKTSSRENHTSCTRRNFVPHVCRVQRRVQLFHKLFVYFLPFLPFSRDSNFAYVFKAKNFVPRNTACAFIFIFYIIPASAKIRARRTEWRELIKDSQRMSSRSFT